MIQFFFENTEPIEIDDKTSKWLKDIITLEGKKPGKISYIFGDDDFILEINKEYLQHDYYTDIITFDYVKGKTISGDIFVSLQRISDNATTLSTGFDEEFRRVLAHGILHLCGYKDKSESEQLEMRSKENQYLAVF